MALTKEIKIDRIEIVNQYKIVQVRTATIISEDGVEISRTFTRDSYSPDEDISNEAQEIQAVCNAVWTDEIKQAWTDKKIASDLANLEKNENK